MYEYFIILILSIQKYSEIFYVVLVKQTPHRDPIMKTHFLQIFGPEIFIKAVGRNICKRESLLLNLGDKCTLFGYSTHDALSNDTKANDLVTYQLKNILFRLCCRCWHIFFRDTSCLVIPPGILCFYDLYKMYLQLIPSCMLYFVYTISVLFCINVLHYIIMISVFLTIQLSY